MTESEMRSCYVCKKEPAKRCTSCFQIAYCSVSCQKSDWKYHKVSCLQKSVNVVDSLINLHNFEHILINICSYLSGADLHYFGCVKRSWRDLILRIGSSEIERKLWRTKLDDQWKRGGARVREIVEYKHDISAMKVSGSELFVDVFGKKEIHVYDITTGKFKFSLRAAERNASDWDVHKDFLLIYDGEQIYLWDRHKHIEEDIDDSVQMKVGTHYRKEGDNDPYNGLEYKNVSPMLKGKGPEGDKPVKMRIFTEPADDEDNEDREYDTRENVIVIVYESGIVTTWEYFSPYQVHHCMYSGDEIKCEKFTFNIKESSDHLARFQDYNCALHGREMLVGQTHHDYSKPWDKFCPVFYLYGSQVISFELCYNFDHAISIAIEDVDYMYTFFESQYLWRGVAGDEESVLEGYLIVRKKFTAIFEEYEELKEYMKIGYENAGQCPLRDDEPPTFEEWKKEQIVQEDDEMWSNALSFLDVYARTNWGLRFRRRMRIEGRVINVSLNDQHMAVSLQKSSFGNYIEIYDAKEVIADIGFCTENEVKYVKKPVPIQYISLGKFHVPENLLLAGVNRLIWSESIDDVYNFDIVYNPRSILKCVNFWMT